MIAFTLIVTLATFSFSAKAGEPAVCDQSTLDEIQCYQRIGDRAEIQLEKDWNYLMQLVASRDREALRHFNVSEIAYNNFVPLHCQSEGHDALGGSLEEVLVQKCRRDTFLARRKLFERIAEENGLGRRFENVFGRPICRSYLDKSKPLHLDPEFRTGDVELLRKKLDEIERAAIADGIQLEDGLRLREVHEKAESLRITYALHTCLGIRKAFCPGFESVEPEWLSRCQTEILGAYYKRASKRYQQLKLNAPSN